ncbi:hypothetical protein B0H10DRAFT_2115750 [Mycena sp. CBHHK59/15]|nr:hypothetical protein B0H10DRAFT_2115750 [Mycena sp. CBHHK59/15]
MSETTEIETGSTRSSDFEDLEGLTELARANAPTMTREAWEQLRQADNVKRTLKDIYAELEALTECTGVHTLLLSTRGRYEDLIEAQICETGDGMDFMRTVFGMDSSELAARMDAWAVTKGGARSR